MTKKKHIDLCSLADGNNIVEIAYYGPSGHKYLKQELEEDWENEILLPFKGQYSKDKTIAAIDYVMGDTMQIFGIGNTPEEAVKSALTKLIAKYPKCDTLVSSAQKVIKEIDSHVWVR